MNLREVPLSSRCVIPVALALPINREPLDPRLQEEWLRRQRDAADPSGKDRGATTVSFYI